MSAKIPLKDIVARVKMDLNISDTRMDLAIRQYCIDCLVDLNLFISNDTVTKEIEVDANGISAQLPDDFIKYRRIGVVVDGRICVLRLGQDLAFRQSGDKSWCEDSADPIPGVRDGQWYGHSRNGQFVYENYGSTSSNASIPKFRINPKTRKIEFSTNLSVDSVILEYIGTGDALDDQTRISRVFMPVIRAFVHWQLTEYATDTPVSLKARREDLYLKEYKKAQFHEKMFTVEDFIDAIYSASTASVK